MDNRNYKDLTSKYNEAMLQIGRLSNLWSRDHEAYLNGNFGLMCSILDRIWIELSADAKRKNPKYFETMNKINNEINISYNEIIKTQHELASLNSSYNRESDTALKMKFHQAKMKYVNSIGKKEIFLKDLQQEIGKGSSYKDRSEDSIL